MKKSDFKIVTPKKIKANLLLAHGAGAPMDSDWMNQVCDYLKDQNIQTIRFEFPYMANRRKTGKKSPPNSKKALLECFDQAIEFWSHLEPLYIGGKSMGGRMASLISEEWELSGLIVFGFPFHPPGRPPGDRLENLKSMEHKTLIIQGERDPFGNQEEVKEYKLSKKIKLHWAKDGDHSLAPRKSSGLALEDNLESAMAAITKFI